MDHEARHVSTVRLLTPSLTLSIRGPKSPDGLFRFDIRSRAVSTRPTAHREGGVRLDATSACVACDVRPPHPCARAAAIHVIVSRDVSTRVWRRFLHPFRHPVLSHVVQMSPPHVVRTPAVLQLHLRPKRSMRSFVGSLTEGGLQSFYGPVLG